MSSENERFLPPSSAEPDLTYQERVDLQIGVLNIELVHAKGETDDHTWSYIPAHKAICAGDFLIWAFPNAGNPQKVQRFPAEWAAAMRAMADKDVEMFLPAHGLPIAGKERIKGVLTDVAEALEFWCRNRSANERRYASGRHRARGEADPSYLESPHAAHL